MNPTIAHALRLWRFMGEGRAVVPGDLLVVCGSYDVRVCEYACELFEAGGFERMLLTGGTGNWTKHLWDEAEAEVFARIARARGLPEARLIVEPLASNFAENVAFARRLVPQARSATFVTKPNSVRRLATTIPVQWPDLEAGVAAPAFEFPDEVSNQIGVLGKVEELVGDIHRMLVYPGKGFQVPVDVPEDVLASWRFLIGQGFAGHLLPERNFLD